MLEKQLLERLDALQEMMMGRAAEAQYTPQGEGEVCQLWDACGIIEAFTCTEIVRVDLVYIIFRTRLNLLS